MKRFIGYLISFVLIGLLVYDIQYKPVKIITQPPIVQEKVVEKEVEKIREIDKTTMPGMNIEKIDANTYALYTTDDSVWQARLDDGLSRKRIIFTKVQ